MLSRAILLVLFLFVNYCQAQYTSSLVNSADSIYSTGDKEAALITLKPLNYWNDQPSIEQTEALELAGLIYLSKNELDKTKFCFQRALLLKKHLLGEHHFKLCTDYTLNAKYYGFLIEHKTAFAYADSAYQLMHRNYDKVSPYDKASIYKEYAYQIKIYYHNELKEEISGRKIALCYLDTALMYASGNHIMQATINRDIGNIYNDLSKHDNIDKKQFLQYYQRSDYYYKETILHINASKFPNGEMLATTLFVQGLLNSTLRDTSLCRKAFYCFDSALSQLNDGNQILGKSINAGLFLNILNHKVNLFMALFNTDNNPEYIKQAYQEVKYAIPYWLEFISELNSSDLDDAAGIYMNYPFDQAIPIAYNYQELYPKDSSLNKEYLLFMELAKYPDIYRPFVHSLDSKMLMPLLKQNIQKLNPNEAFVEYFLNNQDLYGIIIQRNKISILSKVFCPDLDSVVLNWRSSIINRDNQLFNSSANYLSTLLIQPWISQLDTGINKLIFAPHKKLWSFPFEMLPLKTNDENSIPLFDKYNVSTAFNLFSYTFPTVQDIFDYKISSFMPRFDTLTSLHSMANLNESLGNYHEYQNCREYPSSVSSEIFFIGSHTAEGNKLNFDSLYITDNQTISLLEIERSKINSKLAILAACQTGAGKINRIDDNDHYSKAFYLAGVPSTISTLWPVDEKATAIILEQFFKELSNGVPASLALRNSKKYYLSHVCKDETCLPFYWAGLVYTGLEQTILIRKKPAINGWQWIGIAILSITGMIVIGNIFTRSFRPKGR